jgi:hypothetical protein
MPQAKLIEVYHLAIEKGHSDKASFIESFIDDELEEYHVPEAGKARSDMVRERAVRETRPARHQFRA